MAPSTIRSPNTRISPPRRADGRFRDASARLAGPARAGAADVGQVAGGPGGHRLRDLVGAVATRQLTGAAVLCVDCGRPSRQRPRCSDCEAKNPTPHGYGYQWTKIRRAFLRANPSCAKCHAKAVQIDHKTPLREGGTHAWENLQSLCLKCHGAKSKRERR